MRDSNTAPIQEEPVLNDSITWGGTDVHKECLKVTAPGVARTKEPPKNWKIVDIKCFIAYYYLQD